MDNDSQERSKKSLWLLLLAVFIDLFGFGIIIPILPFFATNLGASELEYGLIIASYSLMQFIFSPLWGKLSDNVGRRPVILIGLGGASIGFVIFGLATKLWMIYLARIVAGVFTAATLTTANAYIADTTPPKERAAAFGLIAAAFGLGFAFGPGIGGLLAKTSFMGISGYALPSFFAALMALLNLVGAFFYLPESLPLDKRGKSRKQSILSVSEIKRIFKMPNVSLYIIIFGLSSFGFSNLIASFSLYAPRVDESIDETKLGYYFTYAGIVLVFSQIVLIRPLLKKFGEEFLVKLSSILMLIGFITLPYAPSLLWMFVTNTPLLLGISFIGPALNSLLSQNTSQEDQGSVMGVNQGFASLMRVFGPITAGFLLGINNHYPFHVGAIIFAIITVITLIKFNGRIPQISDESQIMVISD